MVKYEQANKRTSKQANNQTAIAISVSNVMYITSDEDYLHHVASKNKT